MDKNMKRSIVGGAATGFLVFALLLACLALGSDGTGLEIKGSSDTGDGVVGWTGASDKSGVYGYSQMGNGVTGRSEAVEKKGVAGMATADYGIGVYGDAVGLNGVGVYGRSKLGTGVDGRTTSTNEWVPALYGKNAGAGDGVYGWSQNRHGTVGVTSSQSPDDAGVYGMNHGAGPAIKAEGDLVVTGAYRGNIGPNGGASFPRPAYDSGWVPLNQGERKTLTHNIGGNVDNYVVDLQFSDPSDLGRHQYYYGGETWAYSSKTVDFRTKGAYWYGLSNQQINVQRMSDDYSVTSLRIRIWVYN